MNQGVGDHSVSQTTIRLVKQLAILPVSFLVILPVDHFIEQWISESGSQPASQPISRSVKRSIDESDLQLKAGSVNRSIVHPLILSYTVYITEIDNARLDFTLCT